MVTLTMGIEHLSAKVQSNLAKCGVLVKNQYNWPITSGYEIHRKAIMVENRRGRYTPLEINY